MYETIAARRTNTSFDTFFGLVQGFDEELGYFSLEELEQARGPGGLTVERDLSFKPRALSQVARQGRAA